MNNPKEPVQMGPVSHEPRAVFHRSGYLGDFEKVAETEAFHVALDYALLELLREQPSAFDLNHGWDAHSRVEGAKRFIEIVRTFHLPSAAPRRQAFPNLKPTQ